MLFEGDYKLILGDCLEEMAKLPASCIDAAVFSPPFPSIFSYTSLESDLGNSEDLKAEVPLHFSFFFRQIRRIIKPGRVMMVHCQQIMNMKRSGGQGMYDFRGLLIRLARRAGFIYEYDWLVRKDPQAQAIRTKSRSLQFAGLESDRAKSRGAMGDYLVKFVVPGDNLVPINSNNQVSRNKWIELAECCWDDIRETDTLNLSGTKGPEDVKHICALQLKVIRNLVKLYSNPNEIVFSPFAGIGSEGSVALELGRRFVGCEIKPEYHATAINNLEAALKRRAESNVTLFDKLPEPELSTEAS